MSTFKLAIIYLFWIVIVALSINVFNIYSNIEKPNLGFLELSTYEKFIEPAAQVSRQTTHKDFININSSSISTSSLGIVEFNAGYIIKNLGHLLIPFLLMLMVVPPFFFLMKKNVNKALKWRFFVLVLWGLGLISAIYLTERYGLTDSGVLSSSTKLTLAFLSLACFSYALWLLFSVYSSYKSKGPKDYIKPLRSILNYFVPILLCLLMIETLLLFMDVAVLFPTSPKVGGYWMSPQVSKGIVNSGISSLFTQEISLKFIQKLLSYTVLVFVFVMWFKSSNLRNKSKTKKSIKLLTILISFQVILGLIAMFLLDLSIVGLLHHIASICILIVTIHLVALSNDQGVNLRYVNPKIKLNRYSLDVPIVKE